MSIDVHKARQLVSECAKKTDVTEYTEFVDGLIEKFAKEGHVSVKIYKNYTTELSEVFRVFQLRRALLEEYKNRGFVVAIENHLDAGKYISISWAVKN